MIEFFFPSSSIPSKGKCLYNFSARSEKAVYLNALKCRVSLGRLGIFKMTYKALGSGESDKWGYTVLGEKTSLFLNMCPLLQGHEASMALP